MMTNWIHHHLCGLLSSDLAAGMRRVKGVKKLGLALETG
jgi:hypothetical protein